MLRHDLKAAGIPYRDSAGRVFDFHGLRHAYISAVVAGGASVKTAQELARHSTPTLTIGRYSHARLHDLVGALDALPKLTTAQARSEPTLATGTDLDRPQPKGVQQIRQQLQHEPTRDGATPCEEMPHDHKAGNDRKALSITAVCDDVRDNAKGSANAPRRTRTFNTRIKSPLQHFTTDDKTNTSKPCNAHTSSSPSSCAQERSKTDPDLAKLIDAWPTLPEPVKAGIRAMVEAARSSG